MLLRGVIPFGSFWRRGPAPRAIQDPSPAERRAADRVTVERSALLRWQEQGDSALAVQVFDRSPEGVGLFLPQELPVGLIANVLWEGGETMQAVVRHCRQRESQFVAGLKHLPIQRRSEQRQPRHEAARLIWDDVLEGRVEPAVHLVDVSLGGLRCHSPRRVAVPMVACLTTADWQYYGTTRYCEESESGYSVGIQIVRAELAVEPGLLLG